MPPRKLHTSLVVPVTAPRMGAAGRPAAIGSLEPK